MGYIFNSTVYIQLQLGIYRCYQTCIEKKRKQRMCVIEMTFRSFGLVYLTTLKFGQKEVTRE